MNRVTERPINSFMTFHSSEVAAAPQRRNEWRTLAMCVLSSGVALHASLFSASAAEAIEDDLDNRGVFFRLGGGIRAGVSADIRNINPVAVRPEGTYDNGYVSPDVGGSTDTTWNWGFNSQTQLSGDRLTLNKTENAPRLGDLTSLSDSPMFGGEVFGGLEVIRPRFGKKDVRIGFEIGYGFNTFSVKGSTTASSTATYTTGVYDTTGIVPPTTPEYHGTFEGPGPIISLQPVGVTSVDAVGSSVLNASLDADLNTIKVGSWVQIPLSRHFLVGISLGLASIYASADMEFSESTVYEGGAIPAPASFSSRVTRNDWRVGAYTQVRLEYEFNRHWGVFIGGDAQWNPNMKFEGGGREATLKFEGTYGGSGGVSFRF